MSEDDNNKNAVSIFGLQHIVIAGVPCVVYIVPKSARRLELDKEQVPVTYPVAQQDLLAQWKLHDLQSRTGVTKHQLPDAFYQSRGEYIVEAINRYVKKCSALVFHYVGPRRVGYRIIVPDEDRGPQWSTICHAWCSDVGADPVVQFTLPDGEEITVRLKRRPKPEPEALQETLP